VFSKDGTGVWAVGDSGFVHRLNLTYKPNDDLLFYATWSRGFRPGGGQHQPAREVALRHRAMQQVEPGVGGGEGRAAADGRHLEAREPDRRVEAAVHLVRRPVRHRARPDHADVLASRDEERRDRGRRRERDRLHPRRDGAVRPDEGEVGEVVQRGLQDSANGLRRERALGDHCLPVSAALEVAV